MPPPSVTMATNHASPAHSLQQISTLTGHDTSVYCVRMSGGMLYSASADHTVRQWDVAKGRPTRIYNHPDWVRTLEVGDAYRIPNGPRETEGISLSSGWLIRNLWRWDVLNWQVRNSYLFTAGRDGDVRAWEIDTQSECHKVCTNQCAVLVD